MNANLKGRFRLVRVERVPVADVHGSRFGAQLTPINIIRRALNGVRYFRTTFVIGIKANVSMFPFASYWYLMRRRSPQLISLSSPAES